ncbi:PTS sugar transporter subunit IIA [Caballeronia sp. GAFFF3]|uniref:PTS sugar transporter subunit IIA n=1 Tax=Caballeronia sp. GAFFF3 TaxID=2921759 RepID=UPI0020297546|nr:PTS sugar transporter subunit IIA [Caballeronia sp. GAFFF3]
MVSALSAFIARLGFARTAPGRVAPFGESRHVMVHVTIDAKHATPLRRSLVRDCVGEPWTIRVTPLHERDRVRLTLILPRTALHGAIDRLSDVAPSAKVSGLLEVPDTPSDAWRNLMERSVSIGGDSAAHIVKPRDEPTSLSGLLTPEHILLGGDIANRDALFSTIGRFVDHRYGFAADQVTSCLAAREALGSTALGEGVAVPHGQLEEVNQAMALYIRPAAPIPYAAPDGKPVTDVIALFVPERVSMTHLHLLGEVAEHFCDHRFREQLHLCRNATAVCRLFADFPVSGPARSAT